MSRQSPTVKFQHLFATVLFFYRTFAGTKTITKNKGKIMAKKALLMILDGWGNGKHDRGDVMGKWDALVKGALLHDIGKVV
ncbi:MAG: hypothetical protein ACFN4V_08185, partial [Prevotella denticola]